jgi:hypothetical protein
LVIHSSALTVTATQHETRHGRVTVLSEEYYTSFISWCRKNIKTSAAIFSAPVMMTKSQA